MFARLDKLPNLRISSSATSRTLHGGRNDGITDLLAKCSGPAEIAIMAHRFGISRAEISQKAKNASSFGQFRMAIGNKLRGICSRLEQSLRKGDKLSLKKAANPL